MGYKHNEDDILAAAVEAVLDEGLSRLSFGRLAKRIGVADRSIVYYFPTKADLITRTAFAIGGQLQTLLNDAFGDETLSADDLVRRAWPVLTSAEADPVFAVFFELVGLGAAGVAPFDSLAPVLIETWVEWLQPKIDEPDPARARSVALATIAILDGLILLRHIAGGEAAASAAQHLGYLDG